MKELPIEGKKIKDFSVVLTDGTKKSLSDLAGKKGLVLYFYPKDNTPGCTKEACSFRDGLEDLAGAGYSVAGVSPDSPLSHQKFTSKFSLNFPLIADESKELAEYFGVYREKKNYGKTYMGIVRTTFVLDGSLKLLRIYEKVKPEAHAAEILSDLKGTQAI